MILPELGGRVQMALDKTNDYHFVYCNRVINPLLVADEIGCDGLRPVDWQITAGPDGSKTIWCTEWQALSQTKRMQGFRLYPERAYLEVDVRLYNASSVPQSCFWGANLAFQIAEAAPPITLPDLRTVMDAGLYTVAGFPPATKSSTNADPALPSALVGDSNTSEFISNSAYAVNFPGSWPALFHSFTFQNTVLSYAETPTTTSFFR